MRLARPGVAHLWIVDSWDGRRMAMPYGSLRERATLEHSIAAAKANAAWMAEQARLDWPLFDEPEVVTPAQADELRAMWALQAQQEGQ